MNRRNQMVRVAVAMLSLAAATAFAQAKQLNFCAHKPEAPYCVGGKIINKASVIVTKVIVKQRAGGKKNCLVEEKTHNRDLAGKKNTDFLITLNKRCSYVVEFKTTGGCGGNKRVTLSVADVAAGKTYVQLLDSCGSLRANNKKYKAKPES